MIQKLVKSILGIQVLHHNVRLMYMNKFCNLKRDFIIGIVCGFIIHMFSYTPVY